MNTPSSVVAKMPKQVRVGCYIFTVEMGETWAHDGEFGHVSLETQSIRLRKGGSSRKLANTFLHEVLHSIHWVYGLGDASNEEQFTELSANGLCSFWLDNPQAMQWIKELLGVKA